MADIAVPDDARAECEHDACDTRGPFPEYNMSCMPGGDKPEQNTAQQDIDDAEGQRLGDAAPPVFRVALCEKRTVDDRMTPIATTIRSELHRPRLGV